jgi:aminoglycoside phosphotransferase (APT) family kinase protein
VSRDPVDRILAAYGIPGPWDVLPATGVANRIYATSRFVLRIATDHRDALPNARAESVAATAAYCAGIRTPLLVVFDDSRILADRPFSIWERVHADTLGLLTLDRGHREDAWREVGQELARLHDRVLACPDPRGYLDTPGYDLNLPAAVKRLRDEGSIGDAAARDLDRLLDELAPYVAVPNPERCFVHNDLHDLNVMCTATGKLVALIDWGDAGWGDPAVDFTSIPLDMIPAALDGYGSDRRRTLGPCADARFVWLHLQDALDHIADGRSPVCTVDDLRRFLDAAGATNASSSGARRT